MDRVEKASNEQYQARACMGFGDIRTMQKRGPEKSILEVLAQGFGCISMRWIYGLE